MPDDSPIPEFLADTVALLGSLSEHERREALIEYARSAGKWEPDPDVEFEYADTRHDRECVDEVGVFLGRVNGDRLVVRMRLGAKVQTLTQSLAALLCRGLDGATPQDVLALDHQLIDAIVGARLVRLRSQTIYYLLDRLQEGCRALA